MWWSTPRNVQPEVIPLSLTNPSRDGLRADILAWLKERGPIEGRPTKDDVDALGKIGKRWLPEQEKLANVAFGRIIGPLRIENTPEEYLDFIPAPDRSSRRQISPRQFLSYYVALSVYGAIGAELGKYDDVLTRKKPTDVPDRSIHKDLEEITIYSSPVNAGKAKTRFINFTTALKQLSKRHIHGIIVHDRDIRVNMPLDEYAEGRNLDGPGPVIIDIQRELCDPVALKALDRAIDANARDIELKPNQIVMWNNGKIFHQAQDYQTADMGPPPFDDFNRIIIHVAGESPARVASP